jgi:tight adherence protein C
VAVLVAIFILVVGAALLISRVTGRRHVSRQRLLASAHAPIESPIISSLRADQADAAWVRLVNRIEKAGLSLVDTKDDTLKRNLAAAGFFAPYAPRVFTLIRLLLVILLPVLSLSFLWMTGSSPSLVKLWFMLIIPAALGLYLPNMVVRARAERRRREIINGFPDALDLMLVCVEAGLALESAFDRVGKEMNLSHPLLAEQLGTVVLELRAGRSREDALRRLADRTGTDEIRAFATLLIQSTNLGTSVAQTLRVYASEMRERRRMRAEEKAHRLPVLLSIPLVACMLPVMVGVLMLPAAIRVMRNVLPALSGGG